MSPANTADHKIRDLTFALSFGLILMLQGWMLWIHGDADPSKLVQDQVVAEHYWPLVEARANIYQHQGLAEQSQGRAAWVWLSQQVFRNFGVSLASSRYLNLVACLLATCLVMGFLLRRYGPRAALLGGWLLAMHPSWNAQVQLATPQPIVAAVIVGLLWFQSCGLYAWILAAILSILLSLSLDPICVLPAIAGLPSLFMHINVPRNWRRYEWSVVLLAAVGGMTFYLTEWHLHWQHLEQLRIYPLLLLWAWCSTILVFFLRCRLRAVDRSMSFSLWGGIFAVSFGISEFGMLSSVVPLLVIHSVAMVERLGKMQSFGRLTFYRVTPVVFFVAGVLGLVFIGKLIASPNSQQVSMVPAALIAVFSVLCCLVLPVWRFTRNSNWLSTLGFSVSIALWAPIWIIDLGHLTYTQRQASRQLASVLLPTARLSGDGAALLCFENDLLVVKGPVVQVGIEATFAGSSHLLTIGSKGAKEGASMSARPLSLVEVFHVQGNPIRVFRILGTAEILSAFEEGLGFVASGKLAAAKKQFESIVRSDPEASAAWAQLAFVIKRKSVFRQYYRYLLLAERAEPQRVEVQLALASLFQRSGQWREVLRCLQAAAAAEPGNKVLRRAMAAASQQLAATEKANLR